MLKSIIESVVYGVLWLVSMLLSTFGISDEPLDAKQFEGYQNTAWLSEETGTKAYIDESASKVIVTFKYNNKIVQGELENLSRGCEVLTQYGYTALEAEDEVCSFTLFETNIRMSDEEMIWYNVHSEKGTEFSSVDEIRFEKVQTDEYALENLTTKMVTEPIEGFQKAFKADVPQIDGMLDTEREKRLNQIILEQVKNEFKQYQQEQEIVIKDVSTQIMRNDEKIFSFLLEGKYTDLKAKDTYYFAFTVNIDVLHEKAVETKGLIDDTKTFCKKLKQGDFHKKVAKAGADSTKNVYPKEYMEGCTIQELEKTLEDVQYYIKENKLGMVFTVNHAFGDYILIETDDVDLVCIYE